MSSVSLHLTPRQVEICRYLPHGKHDREIAEELGICLHAVHGESKLNFDRLGVRSRVGLINRLERKHLAILFRQGAPQKASKLVATNSRHPPNRDI
ncbi:MAG: LuxR C-terminal-related transcriptional regulator [Thermoguttaceae bacterium]